MISHEIVVILGIWLVHGIHRCTINSPQLVLTIAHNPSSTFQRSQANLHLSFLPLFSFSSRSEESLLCYPVELAIEVTIKNKCQIFLLKEGHTLKRLWRKRLAITLSLVKVFFANSLKEGCKAMRVIDVFISLSRFI